MRRPRLLLSSAQSKATSHSILSPKIPHFCQSFQDWFSRLFSDTKNNSQVWVFSRSPSIFSHSLLLFSPVSKSFLCDPRQGKEGSREPTEKQQAHSKSCVLYTAYAVTSQGWLFSLRNINYIHKLLQRDYVEPCLASDITYYNLLWCFFGFDIVPAFLSHKAFTIRFQKWCAEALPVSCGEQTGVSNQEQQCSGPGDPAITAALLNQEIFSCKHL